jgi:hypothetical protein
MSRHPVRLQDKLHSIYLAISGALANADIQEYLAEFNWDVPRIEQGHTLYEAALQLVQKQRAEYGDQCQATQTLQAARKKAADPYMRYLKVARTTFKGDVGAAQKLDLNSARARALSGWLKQARQFYEGALQDETLLSQLAEDGITRARLTAGKALVDAVEEASIAQAKERGEAQDATQARNAALKALNAWHSDFIAVARVALQDRPQLLEKLGLVAPS